MQEEQYHHHHHQQPHDTVYTYQNEDWPWVWAIREGLVNDDIDRDDRAPKEVLDREQDEDGDGNNRAVRPVPILFHLWIGTQLAACQTDRSNMSTTTPTLPLLSPTEEGMRFTHVINLSGNPCPEHWQKENVLEIPEAVDVEGYPLLHCHLPKIQDFVATMNHSNNDMCFIYSEGGCNRAGIVVAALVLLETKWSVLKVVQLLRRQFGKYVLSNESFQEQLVALARIHGLLGTQPGTTATSGKNSCGDEVLVTQSPPPSTERETPVNWYNMTLCDCGKC